MTQARPNGGTLIERAAAIYGYSAPLRARVPDGIPEERRPAPPAPVPTAPTPPVSGERLPMGRRSVAIDRALLEQNGLLVPGAAIGAQAEEFRLAKRQLLLAARAMAATNPAKARTILVCSPGAQEGKTYCAINLAISMAAERDTRVLLVDADFAKPDVMARLGVEDGPGLLDAIADPRLAIEQCVVATDIPQLSLLPAGGKSTSDTELAASDRTRELIAELLAADPHRIIVFDSPPALAASPASVLALQVGQVMLVVRADHTAEGELREAVQLLDGCDRIQLLLNKVALAPRGNRLGGYYGLEDSR
ncbi:AAA family ATPase [uncultured Sphingomonas sp.]|uniref:AAA family ATPase n=1 Tax=uncultured Sphingomonas sp. TaxID=158754 RepID=UPI0035CBBF07